MQANLFMISDQNPISLKSLHFKKGSAEEGHDSSREITGLFSSLVKMLNEQKPHSGAFGELNGSRKGNDKGEVDPTGQGKMFKGNGTVGHLKSTTSETVLDNSDVKPDEGKVAKKKKTASPNEILEAARLLNAFGFETSEPVSALGVLSDKIEKLNSHSEKIPAQKAATGTPGTDLTKVKDAPAKGAVSADAILKAVDLLKALGIETTEQVKTSGAAVDKIEKPSNHSEKIPLQKADAGNTAFDLTKGKDAPAKEAVSADAIVKAVDLLKALGIETTEQVKTSGAAVDKIEKPSNHSEKIPLQKADAGKIVFDLTKGKDAPAKGTVSDDAILKAVNLLKELGFETSEPDKKTTASIDKIEKLSSHSEKDQAQKAATGNTAFDLTKGKDAPAKEAVSADAIVKAVDLLKALGIETTEQVKTSGAAVDKIEKPSNHSEKIPLQKADAGNIAFDLTKGKDAPAKGTVSDDAILKAVNLLKELGFETSEPDKKTTASIDKIEKLSSHSEKDQAQKAATGNTAFDLTKGKDAPAKGAVSADAIVKAVDLLKAVGFETNEQVRTFGAAIDKIEKPSNHSEKMPLQKADAGNIVFDPSNGKDAPAKGTVSAEAILKAVNLLKALGFETTDQVRTSGAAFDKIEKLSSNSEKIPLQKADAGTIVFDLTKEKDAPAKGTVNADAILKAVDLLKALGFEKAVPVKISGVAGEKTENLKSHSEQTPLQKADAANISTDLNREKEGSDKVLASSANASLSKGKDQLQIRSDNVGSPRYGQSPHEKKEGQRKNITQTDRKAPFFETTPSKAEAVYSNRAAAVDESKSDDMNGQSKKDHASGFNAMSRKGADRGKNMPVDSSQEVTASKFKVEFENPVIRIGSRENNDDFLSHQADRKNESGSNGNSHLILKNHVSSEKAPVNVFQSKEGSVFKQADQADTLNQIVKKAALHLGNGRSECRIDLKPESLGHLKMLISTENHQVTVKIVADNNVVKQIIEGNLNQLKADFQNQGMIVEKFDVSVGGDSKQEGMGYDTGAFHERAKAGDHAGYGGGRQFGQSENLEQKDLLTRGSLNEGAVDFFA